MPRDLIPQKIVDAILRAGGTTIYNMDIAAHPTGPGYCVYDGQGNVACFDYDPSTDRATIRYSTIPGVGKPPETSSPQLNPVSASSSPSDKPTPAPLSVDDLLHPVVSDTTWSYLPPFRAGFIPGFFEALAVIVVFLGIIFGVASFSLLFFFLIFTGSCILAAFFAWMAAVLRSLRHIETQIYCANHPDWVSSREIKKAGE